MVRGVCRGGVRGGVGRVWEGCERGVRGCERGVRGV